MCPNHPGADTRQALCGFVDHNHLSSSARVVGIRADLEGLGVDCAGQTTYEDFEAAVLRIDMVRCGVGEDKSDCHFRTTATEYDRKPGVKWLSRTAK